MRYSSLLGTRTLRSRSSLPLFFGTYVKTITLSFVEYEDVSMEEWYVRTYQQGTDRTTGTSPRSNRHLAHAFGVYSRIQEETLEIMNSGELVAKLCVILRNSPNTRKMILTDCGNYFDGNDPNYTTMSRLHDLWSEDDLCPFKGCKLSYSDHLRFHVRPSPPYNMTPNPFHLAMLAISTAKSTIRDLAMIHETQQITYPVHSFLSKATFVMTIEQSSCLTLQLQQLLKLRIRLGQEEGEEEEEGGGGVQAQTSHASSPIAKALSSAVNLESLFIEGYFQINDFRYNSLTTMSCCLGGCRFPKLRSLILRSMDSKEDELLEFLKASPNLKHLTLDEFTLADGSRQTMAERIRSVLRLESIMFGHLYVRLLDLENDKKISHEDWMVEDFFLHNGKYNPFTKEAMEFWDQEDEETSRAINMELDVEERYRMFH